jgi:Antibiotic biosynthesis monooxygenase
MYISVRKYESDPATTDEVIRRVDEGFAPLIAADPGFVKYYCFRNAQGIVSSISIFDSEEQAEASNRVAAKWVRQHLSELLPHAPEIVAGELLVYC